MKKFISGLIVGIMIMVSMSVFADSLNVKTNPFPVLVNGVRQAVDAYNINGSTYIKLSDVAKATEGAVNVKFDGESQVININTGKSAEFNELVKELPEVVDVTVDEKTEGIIEKPATREYVKNDIIMIMHNGKEYGRSGSLSFHANGLNFNSATGEMFATNLKTFEKLEDIPYITIDGWDYIEMDYYYNTILPFLE